MDRRWRMFISRTINNLVNSYGKSFKCLQRIITVSSTNDAGEASEKAKREFERLENVPNWKYHAQFLEMESSPNPPARSLGHRVRREFVALAARRSDFAQCSSIFFLTFRVQRHCGGSRRENILCSRSCSLVRVLVSSSQPALKPIWTHLLRCRRCFV